MDSDLVTRLKKRLVEVMKLLSKENFLVLNEGHVSVRIPRTDRILVPAHIHEIGRTIASLTPDDIVTMDTDGNLIEGPIGPPGEKHAHTGVYQKREDIGAVIHGHPPFATAFSIAGVEIVPVHLRGSMFAPKVPIHPSSDQVDNIEFGRSIAELMGDGYAVLLKGHGCVVAGGTLEEACAIALNLEFNAWQQYLAATLGTPQPIDPRYIQKKVAKGLTMKEMVSNVWCYYAEKHGISTEMS